MSETELQYWKRIADQRAEQWDAAIKREATLKEQNALLTVQVQEADKREWLMGQLIGEIASAGGKYPYVNNTELVRDAHKVMRDCLALTTHPQQVKSEDARDAERYRFMCGQGRYVPDPFGNGWAFGMGQECSKQALDAAIDAAISAQEPKG